MTHTIKTLEVLMAQSVNSPRKVIILSTGGTIEKSYDESDGSLENRESKVQRRILSKLRMPYTAFEVHSILSKDSLHMNEADRLLIVKHLKEYQEQGHPIVLLHGTDTMAVTAKFVFDKIAAPRVPIVFTGAMIPMGFEDSDARQNVTEAVLVSKILVPGVYISFHNKIFEAPKVRKNLKKGTFEYEE